MMWARSQALHVVPQAISRRNGLKFLLPLDLFLCIQIGVAGKWWLAGCGLRECMQ